MKILVIMLLPFVATACVTTGTVTTVEVPVHVACVKEVPQKPEYETGKITEETSDGDVVLALSRDWAKSRKYESSLEAIVEGCK